MNTIFKKVISILLCAATMFSFSSAKTFAEEINQDYSSYSCDEGIISALQAIEADKDKFNLADVNFEELTVSAPIKAYEYTSDGVSFIYNYIPLMYNNVLTAWAVESEDEDGVFYQISTAYVDEINAIIDNSVSFALIYDKSSCYLFDGSDIHKLGSFDEIESRLDLTENVLDASLIVLNSLNKTHDLGYTHAITPYGVVLPTNTYECPVEHTPQTLSNLCWAASISCIVKYKTGNYYSDAKIAEIEAAVRNEPNINFTIKDGEEVDILYYYKVPYHYINYAPSPSSIANNIGNDYPIFAVFEHNGEGHAVVMYKCVINNQNPYSSLFYIMDPQNNFELVKCSSSSGKYQYTYVVNGKKMTLRYITSKYK